MPEYINRRSVLDEINDRISNIAFTSPYQNEIESIICGMERARESVAEAPTVDVVEVVRCRDCKHRKSCNLMTDDDFCSDGERKGDDG